MKHLTGICANCGKPKEDHMTVDEVILSDIRKRECYQHEFYDSGQKALDDNAAELFEAVSELLNQIEKEK